MTSLSAQQLFHSVGIRPMGPVSWATGVPEIGPGVYVISIPDLSSVQYDERFSLAQEHWFPDQEIVYIGRSKHLAQRLKEFRRQIYGARAPHRGGQRILLLTCEKVIHWTAAADYASLEHRLLEEFEKKIGRKPFGNVVRSARMSRVLS